MELQPAPLSALEMIANEPVRVVQGRKAVCDGGEFWFCSVRSGWKGYESVFCMRVFRDGQVEGLLGRTGELN